MYGPFWNRSLAGLMTVLVLASLADAAPRRFWNRRATTYDSGGLKDIAPKSDPASSDVRALAAYYSYDKAMEQDVAFTDRLRVFLLVRDPEVLSAADSVVAEVKVTDLSREQSTRLRYCPVSFSPTSTPEYQLATFDVENDADGEKIVEPEKTYRLFVNLHRRATQYDNAQYDNAQYDNAQYDNAQYDNAQYDNAQYDNAQYDKSTVLGKIVTPYYVATSGHDRLGRARCHIAMRTFKEFYYAQRGWRSTEDYPMDCYAYYTWATGACTVGAQNGRTMLDRLFGGRRPFQSGGQIVQLARQGAIHGDYVRKPGHSFMLLAYDPHAGHVWTMEGNFNSTIEVVIRSVDSGWTVGHLVDEHIRPGLFEVTRAGTVDTNPPAL